MPQVTLPHPPDLTELRTEGKIAADKGLRIGWYCIEAADEIERLRAALRQVADTNQDKFDNGPCDELAKIAEDALSVTSG